MGMISNGDIKPKGFFIGRTLEKVVGDFLGFVVCGSFDCKYKNTCPSIHTTMSGNVYTKKSRPTKQHQST